MPFPPIVIYLLIALIIIVPIVLMVRGYNRLVTLRNRFKNAYSQIDVQLKRRYDLIPNLVETAKGYLEHERETLESVTQARNQAALAADKAAQSPGDSGAMQELMGAETGLRGSLGKFFALAESYPDLKANQTMSQLMEELTSTENKVAFARQSFNDAVMAYNTAREKIPTNLVASLGNFGPATPFEIEDDSERQAPQVSFS